MNNTEYQRLNEAERPQAETPAAATTNITEGSTHPLPFQRVRYDPRRGDLPEEEKKPTKSEAASKFECNICLDVANEPIVTKCGHLYCWVCIFQWMNQPKETLLCPVCKSGISQESLIPIYTKGNTEDPRKKSTSEIPKRPGGQRMGPVPNQNFSQGGNFFGNRNNGFVMGLSLFPSVFTLNFTWDDIFGSNNVGGANSNNNEETREQQLQRLLLVFMFFMFMSFVFFGGDVFLTF